MKIISNKKDLDNLIGQQKNLGFVPTMGAIHNAHIYLVKKSKSMCKKTIVSIFINKPQFNRKSDYKNYPRNLNKDIRILRKHKVDYLYLPKHKEIYISKAKKINTGKLGKILCGKFRPGHFEAVVDVIDRFINLIKPSMIFLGKKDMQQLKIIDYFVKKNYRNIKIIPCKTIREKNGIAYSSRNFLLSLKEKSIASKIYRIIKTSKKRLINKQITVKEIKRKIYSLGVYNIDYISILNINKITQPYIKGKKFRIFISYYLRKIRLIDNI